MGLGYSVADRVSPSDYQLADSGVGANGVANRASLNGQPVSWQWGGGMGYGAANRVSGWVMVQPTGWVGAKQYLRDNWITKQNVRRVAV